VLYGHGTPIHVDVVNDQLAVSGGLVDAAGFAPMIFVEDDEDGDPFGSVTLPNFGPAIVWQIPGYEIYGMAENSGLFLEVLARPVRDSDPIEQRVLWYWNPETELVENASTPNAFQIRKSSTLSATLLPTSGTAPPPLQIAAPLAGDMGFHNHLVAYALANASPPAVGAYGFFARLSSNEYAPSDPFLVVINNSVFDYPQMIPAALAINAAAFLPGDYNHDDRVNLADYTVWRNHLGTPYTLEDYQVWKSHFGETVDSDGYAANVAATIPEPANLLPTTLAIVGGLIGAGRSRRRIGNSSHGQGVVVCLKWRVVG
jgi:hypothetical protein